MEFDLNWLISVDDHVLEPAHTWQSRIPQRYRDQAPRLVHDDLGEAWVYEGRRYPTAGLSAAAGRSSDEFSLEPISYEDMRPGCYDPTARLADMDRDHVLASLCFPSFPRFCGQTFLEGNDHDLGLRCIEAYNDFMIEEWAGGAPGRLIPMIIIPLWDPAGAVREIERCTSRGARAITMCENPAKLKLPSIHDKDGYWDPVWAACQDADIPVCMHTASSSELITTAPDAPFIVPMTLSITFLSAITCMDWLLSGVLDRFPQLKICLSEGGINWIPTVLERLEYGRSHSGAWAVDKTVSRTPTEVFRQQIYGCFIDEQHGPQNIDAIGIDNVMIETDYPHSDCNWPNSLERAKANLGHLSAEYQWKVLQGNARRVFNFEPAPVPAAVG